MDILATAGTLFGVATSLGFGAMQINAGLAQVSGVPQGADVQVLVIALITLVATISVVVGLHGGIQRLSKLNMALAVAMLLFVFLVGPTVYQLEVLTVSVGGYLQHLVGNSLWLDIDGRGGWQALRTASLTSGLAMAALLLVASCGLLRSLHRDRAVPGVPKRDKLGP